MGTSGWKKINLKWPSLLKQPTEKVECERKLREVLQILVEVLLVF